MERDREGESMGLGHNGIRAKWDWGKMGRPCKFNTMGMPNGGGGNQKKISKCKTISRPFPEKYLN